MSHLDSVDFGKMPWFSIDTVNGLFLYFFHNHIFVSVVTPQRPKEGEEYKKKKCHKTMIFPKPTVCLTLGYYLILRYILLTLMISDLLSSATSWSEFSLIQWNISTSVAW